jgi:hypothetical protein
MGSFAFRSGPAAQRPYFVLLHTGEAPDATTWSRYIEALADRMEQSQLPVHVFAVTDGGGPSSGQRRALAEAFARDQRGAMTHVFTTSTFTRGIVTAFQWLARSRAVAHMPDEFPAVCEQCRIPAPAVLGDLNELQKGLPPVVLLTLLERTARGK